MVDKKTAVLDLLRLRAKTMNGAHPVGAGDGNTYVPNYYGASDARLDLQAIEVIEELEQQLSSAREANRKLHRRAQIGEGLFATVKFDLEMWITTLSSPPRDTSSWIFRYALRHMERRVRRYREKIRALSESSPNPLQEQRDNIGKEGE